jgi:HNH endonuclease
LWPVQGFTMTLPGDVLSYIEMCAGLGVNLQRGMNFRLCGDTSLILMSLRRGAPYADRVEEGGRVLIYEGHDVARTKDCPNPKRVDQPDFYPGGRPTQNGHFLLAVQRYKDGQAPPERVKVFEKIRAGIWVYNGLFALTDAWSERSGERKVFKFRLELTSGSENAVQSSVAPETDRVIPSAVKLEVWRRDRGKCVLCGSQSNLHFDHIIPYSQGGSSRDAENIQILCAKHNLAKHDRIM